MRILAIFIRDIKKFIRNPIVILASIGMPIIYLIVVGNTITGQIKGVPICVVNNDFGGSYSRKIIESLVALQEGPKTLKVTFDVNPERAMKNLNECKYVGVLIIPSDFSKKIARGSPSFLNLLLDTSDLYSSNSLNSDLSGIIREWSAENVSVRLRAAEMRLISQGVYPKIDYDQALVPGIIIMTIFMGTLVTGPFNLVMDRFLGVSEGYLSTPVRRSEILIGLVLSGVLITTALASLILSLCLLITKLSPAGGILSLIMILAVIIISSICMLSMMFAILGRANHPRLIGLAGGFLNVILFFPSGAIYPLYSFPKWLQVVALIDPETYAVRIIKTIIFKGAIIDLIIRDLSILSIFTIFFMLIAIAFLPRRL